MKRVQRIDRVPIRLDGKIERDSRGFARVWGSVVPLNALLTYGRADGYDTDEHVEFVPESTVTDPEAIKTLLFAPVTMPHPPEMLDASNTARHQIGTIIDTKIEDGELRALHLFTDATALDRISGGFVELSPGYTAEIDDTSGVFDGKPYAATQLNRRYNHMAVVDQARAGADNRLFIDSQRAGSGLRIQILNDEEKTTMLVTIDGKEFDVEDAVAAELARLQPNTDQENEEGEKEEEEAAADADPEPSDTAADAGHEPDEPNEDADGSDTPAPGAKKDGFVLLMAKLDGMEDRVAAKVEARAGARRDAAAKAKRASEQAYADARGALPKSYNADGKSAAQIMRDAVVARSPDLKAKADAAMAKHPLRLRGMFDAEMARAPQEQVHSLGDVVPTGEEKRDPLQKRVDEVRAVRHTHRLIGNEAMRHTHAAAAGAS